MRSKSILPLLGAVLLASPTLVRAEETKPCPNTQPKAAKDIVDTAVAAGSFTTLVKAVQAAGLVETLKGPGPFTVFAPTDEAFAKLPAGTVEGLLKDPEALKKVLTYHVVAGRVPASQVVGLSWADTVQGQSARIRVEGGTVRVDEARVLTADIPSSNGIIHVIDTVLLPRKDLVDTAIAAGSFNTLVACVKAAGLVEALKGKGPFTVFAPTDEAFAKLPAATIEALLKDKAKLASILTFHVIPGRVLSTDLAEGALEAKTLDGRPLQVNRAKDGSVTVGGAHVVKADILTGNGIIHVVDTVIVPR
jgi:transforming growth factor-beta-induced protein